MASPSVSLAIEPRARFFTAADLAVMPTHLPSGDIDFELVNGRLIVMVPPGHVNGGIQVALGSAFFVQGQQACLGRAFTDIGVVLSKKPDTVVGPDVTYIAKEKLPVRESPEGYLETIPDLVVEVCSKNDTTAELNNKIAAYLAAGVRIVWVADPATKTIVDHRSDSQPRTYHESETITIDDLIPGFHLTLADVFRM